MGYFGSNSFDNDDAADWLRQVTPRNAVTRIRKALKSARNFSPGDVPRHSREQLEDVIASSLAWCRANPPEHWKTSGRTLENHLEEESRILDLRYRKGQYLDEQYGPIEAAIAAAELVAVWAGKPNSTVNYPSEAMRVVNVLATKPVPGDLLVEARQTVEIILANDRFQRMRSFYLSAFPDLSGGDDQMIAIRDLAKRLA